MSTHIRPRMLVLVVVAAGLAAPCALSADAAAGDRAYTLFMGADVALEIKSAFHKVEDVRGSDLVVRVDGKPEYIPTHKGTARMRIENTLKLAGAPVVLDGLTTERAYTPARDPRRKFSNMAGMSMGTTVAADGSMRNIENAQLALSTAQASTYTPPEQVAAMEANLSNAQGAASAAFSNPGSDLNSVGVQADRMNVELAEGNYDAMNIAFDVSSVEPLDDPFVLVIARIKERGERPDVFRNWIFAQKLDPIDAQPRKVRILQGGMPVGFELADCQVRLYNRGSELATNHSSNSVALTRDEARQYATIVHLEVNKGATVPASVALGALPAGLRARLAAGESAEPVYVKVDAEGRPLGVFIDRECKRASSNPALEAFVADAVFNPALDKGRPVEGVARIELDKLVN